MKTLQNSMFLVIYMLQKINKHAIDNDNIITLSLTMGIYFRTWKKTLPSFTGEASMKLYLASATSMETLQH